MQTNPNYATLRGIRIYLHLLVSRQYEHRVDAIDYNITRWYIKGWMTVNGCRRVGPMGVTWPWIGLRRQRLSWIKHLKMLEEMVAFGVLAAIVETCVDIQGRSWIAINKEDNYCYFEWNKKSILMYCLSLKQSACKTIKCSSFSTSEQEDYSYFP